MRVQKYTKVNGHQIPVFKLGWGVVLYARSTYRRIYIMESLLGSIDSWFSCSRIAVTVPGVPLQYIIWVIFDILQITNYKLQITKFYLASHKNEQQKGKNHRLITTINRAKTYKHIIKSTLQRVNIHNKRHRAE